VVDKYVEDDDDQQADRVHKRVQFLVVPLEVVAQYEVVLETLADVDQPIVVVRVHRGDGGRGVVVEQRRGRVDPVQLSAVPGVARDSLGTLIDAEEHGHTGAESGGNGGKQTDEDFCPTEGQQSGEWLTDAKIAIDCNSDHNECRERDIARDEKLIKLTEEIARHVEVNDLHVHCKRYDDKTGDEVNSRQRDDEQRRRQLVLFLGEHVEYESVSGAADYRQHGQVADNNVQNSGRVAR